LSCSSKDIPFFQLASLLNLHKMSTDLRHPMPPVILQHVASEWNAIQSIQAALAHRLSIDSSSSSLVLLWTSKPLHDSHHSWTAWQTTPLMAIGSGAGVWTRCQGENDLEKGASKALGNLATLVPTWKSRPLTQTSTPCSAQVFS
jgi:hypothetical protein